MMALLDTGFLRVILRKKKTIVFAISDQLSGGAGQQLCPASIAIPSGRLQLIFCVFITSRTGIHTSSSKTYIRHLEVLLRKNVHKIQ